MTAQPVERASDLRTKAHAFDFWRFRGSGREARLLYSGFWASCPRRCACLIEQCNAVTGRQLSVWLGR